MKKIFISLLSLLLFISNLHAQWDSNQILSSFRFDSIDAFGDSFAVTCSGNKIFSTVNGGKTWTSKNLPSGVNYVPDISIVNNALFYIATGDGSFYKTVDGGDTWATIFSNPDLCGYGNYFEMFSESKGIAMGDGTNSSPSPLFLRNTNGVDWIQTCSQPVGWSGDNWRRLDFVDENVGYFMGPSNFSKTTDGGFTWSTLNYPYSYIQVLKFYDADYGLTYQNGTFLKTTDGGTSWVVCATIDPPGWGMDIEFLPGDRNKIWFANGTYLYYSSDGGSTWSMQVTRANSSWGRFGDIVFTSKNVGWALSDFGRILYTSNNGGLATSIESDEILPNAFELSQNYPNPFNPSTIINYRLPTGTHVSLKIYDGLGREVATLVNEFQNAGTYSSSFSTVNSSLVSGTYFYRLTAGNYSSAKKMILMK